MSTIESSHPHRSGDAPPELVRDNPILRQKVWGKMHLHDDNWMAAMVGETGSGKSLGAIRIAEAVDPNFSVDQIAFGVREFLELVNDDSLGRGSVIVFEEASVEANAHEWYSKSNQVLAHVLDTWRHQNRGAIFTLPAFGQLVKPARGRMSALIQMRTKNEDEGFTIATYKRCEQDSDTGKIYKKYPVLDDKKFKYLKLALPSQDLLEAYEKKKADYTQDLNEELLEELIAEEEDEQEEKLGPRDVVDEIVEEGSVEEYIGDNPAGEYMDRALLQADYGLSKSESKQVKKLLIRRLDLDVM